MLLGLILKNVAIAKNVELSFEDNLILFTGETGAGKTIIMNAIAIACGGNANTEIIRTGEETATVEASFLIKDNEKIKSVLEELSLYDNEDVVVISRTISKTKSKVVINGHLVSLKQLQTVGRNLVDLHGQHEIQSLLDKSNHLSYLDKFGFEKINELKNRVISHILEYKEIKKRILELKEQDRRYREERDFINYEIAELEKANLKEGEEEELEKEYKLLTNIKDLVENLTVAQELLTGDNSIIKQLGLLENILSKFTGYSDVLSQLKERVDTNLIDLKELSRDLTNFLSTLNLDPDRLIQIEARLDEISKLKFKYKRNVKELIDYLEELRSSVKGFNELTTEIEVLEKRFEELESLLKKEVLELSLLRREIAESFEKLVEEELKDLAMENAKFKVSLNYVDDPDGIEINGRRVKLFNDGIDTCEFLISPNPPHDFKPLSNIASGGELSRVMLAIKHVIAKMDDIPVLAFDEVDAGIGGKTGEKVATKLLEISKYRQVICITHLPQIASLPGEHFVVEKKIVNGETILSVKRLNEHERINEIARMISGTNITETTIKQAKELLGRWRA